MNVPGPGQMARLFTSKTIGLQVAIACISLPLAIIWMAPKLAF